MSRPSGGNGELARGASAAALKGAALIGLAVIVGVFLLQRVDTSTAGSADDAGEAPEDDHHRARSRAARRRPTSPRPSPATPPKTPDQLQVLVLNGGARDRRGRDDAHEAAAGRLHEPAAGEYVDRAHADRQLGHVQAGLDREAVALSQQTALQGSKVVAFPTPAPPFSADVDCVVVVGG